MFFEAKEAIAYLEMTRRKKYDIDSLKAFLHKYHDFHLSLKCVHVAGTNGKGSTTHYIASILQHSGYKVGSFTSPYLMVHNDRIRINDEYIPDQDLVNILNYFYDDFEAFQLSFFEMDTVIALYYFYLNHVDIAVVEVGLGGRLDATNVILPLISVVVNIGMDHMEYLGNTLEQIAFEKAGIIKENTPLLTIEEKTECLQVFKQVCEQRHAPMEIVENPKQIQYGYESTSFMFEGDSYVILGNATYQPKNASLAIKTAKKLQKLGFDKITIAQIQKGVKDCFWLGRFERISESPLIYIDGAHNVPGIKALCETLNMFKQNGFQITVFFSALKDKEYHKMLEELIQVTNDIWVTQFDFAAYRKSDAKTLMGDFPLKIEEDWTKLYHQAFMHQEEKHLTIFAGSLYFISKVRLYHFHYKEKRL